MPVALVLVANRAMTGHALEFGYRALNGAGHDPGFHMSPYGYEHSALRGVMLASSYLIRSNESLLFWPIPALVVIVAGLLAMARTTRWDLLIFAMIAAFVVAYGAYWFDGDLFGPRFLYPAVPLLVFLAARERMGGRTARRSSSSRSVWRTPGSFRTRASASCGASCSSASSRRAGASTWRG